jgi:hypothetical protein
VLSAPIDAPTQEHVEESLETHASFTAAEAGAWPHAHAAQLAKIALRCAEVSWAFATGLPCPQATRGAAVYAPDGRSSTSQLVYCRMTT